MPVELRQNSIESSMYKRGEIVIDYKSTPGRLARFFRDSRDGWKQKALERQSKLRAADVKVRDLTKSRDKWKREAKETKQRLEQSEKEVEQIRAKKKAKTVV